MEITEIRIKDMQEAIKHFIAEGIFYYDENGIRTFNADRYKEIYGFYIDE